MRASQACDGSRVAPADSSGLIDWSAAYVPKAGATGALVPPADWDDECDGVYDDMLA